MPTNGIFKFYAVWEALLHIVLQWRNGDDDDEDWEQRK